MGLPNPKKDLTFDDNVTRISAPNSSTASEAKLYVDPVASRRSPNDAAPTFSAKVKSTFRVNVPLLPLKVLMFLLYAMAALYPYLTVHMKAIGLSLTESAVIYVILPFASCLGPPLGGALADKLGNYKATMVGFNTASIVFHLLMFLVVPSIQPVTVRTNHTTTEMEAIFGCSDGSNLDATATSTPISSTSRSSKQTVPTTRTTAPPGRRDLHKNSISLTAASHATRPMSIFPMPVSVWVGMTVRTIHQPCHNVI
ncbi:hypothetical protein RvY_01027 [Ramazzottius varieornatus]|uniref:Major facilitator superfamily associated domain-containing protein n=1 Tax=Ramazzottius varieornatus TaxID=947166 RepID=A0A1D1UFS6_RAMVA|nr:hypothetical protein RvY_01027 [Ramazzottius varieornatus]